MKNSQYYGVIKHTAAGFILGFILILIAVQLNYYNGFQGPWFHIFDYDFDFVVIAFSPIYLSLFFCFIGIRREQLVLFTHEIRHRLSQEQIINSAADQQIKLLAKVVAQVNEAIIISDGNGRVQWINEGFTKITGYSLNEVIGKEQGSILDGPLADKTLAKLMSDKLMMGTAVVEELLSYHKNGSTFWLSVSIKPICDDTGRIVNFIAIQKDITGRKEKEIAIQVLYKEVADYKFALDQSAIVIIFNIEGKIVHVNGKFCEINELTEQELTGIDYRSISISMRDKRIVKPIWDTLVAGNTWKGELVNRNKNGKTYWTDTTIVPLLNADDKPYQFLAIQQDITERKELENQLVTNKNKLQQAMQVARLGSWEMDSEGVFTISSELRQLSNLPLQGFLSVDELFKNIHTDDLVHVREDGPVAGYQANGGNRISLPDRRTGPLHDC